VSPPRCSQIVRGGIWNPDSKLLHWHDLRHEALSRLADDGVPVHELQMRAGHASITTTQRSLNARANSLAESMRQARMRRAARVATTDEDQVQAV
jgi:integrase